MSDAADAQMFTPEEICTQAQSNAAAWILTMIAYLKERGSAVEDCVAFHGRSFAPAWEELRGRPVEEVAQLVALNALSVGGSIRSLSSEDGRAELLVEGWPDEELMSFLPLDRDECDQIWDTYRPIMEHQGFGYAWQRQDDVVRISWVNRGGLLPESDPPAELERRAEEVSSAYEDNIVLRSLVVSIPGIGGLLDLVLSSGGQASRERIQRLIEAMKDDMQDRMETIENSALDQKYLESEEFRDLLMRALDATIKTRDEGQRRAYARILTESTISSAREGHSPEEYLDLIADLTPLELRVARSLYASLPRARYERREAAEVHAAWRRWQERVCTDASIDSADLRLILGRLESSGLITEDSALYPSGGGPVDRVPLYWVSLAFEKLMQFLERRDYPLEA